MMWRYVGHTVASTQGWKLYISATHVTYFAVLRIITKIAADWGYSFKYLADLKALTQMNAGLFGYSQVGKNIVVYIDNEVNALSFVCQLKGALRPFAGTAPRPPFATPLDGRLPISYRYGCFNGNDIKISGVVLADDRQRRWEKGSLPFPCPFDDAAEVIETKSKIRELLLSYPIFEVHSQSGKGGVFSAIDLSADVFTEVIVKVGRRNGGLLPDGRDGFHLVRSEKLFRDRAAEAGLTKCVPRELSYKETSEASILIMEKIEGSTLQELRADGKLNVNHVQSALSTLGLFHDKGLLVGDAKIGNFIEAEDGSLVAIDFESWSLAGSFDGRSNRFSTFLLTDKLLQVYPLALEKLHLLYSAIHEEEAEFVTSSSRLVSIMRLLDKGPTCEFESHIHELMKDVLAAIPDLCERDERLNQCERIADGEVS